MNQNIRVIIFLSIVAILSGLLWISIQKRKDNNFKKTYYEVENMFFKWEFSIFNEIWNVGWTENSGSNNIIDKWIISYDTKANEEIKDYYYYNCVCPKWYSYVPESPTYGDPWCETEICKNGSGNCMLYITSVSSTCNKQLNINEVGSRIPMGRKDVEIYYKLNCACPTWFTFVKKTANTYADSCDRKYCVDSECKEIKTWHIWVKNLCKD